MGRHTDAQLCVVAIESLNIHGELQTHSPTQSKVTLIQSNFANYPLSGPKHIPGHYCLDYHKHTPYKLVDKTLLNVNEVLDLIQ